MFTERLWYMYFLSMCMHVCYRASGTLCMLGSTSSIANSVRIKSVWLSLSFPFCLFLKGNLGRSASQFIIGCYYTHMYLGEMK